MHPLAKNQFSKYQKNLKFFVSVHLHILCSLTKFCKKKIFFGAYIKKIIFMVQNYYLHNIFLSFLYRPQKMSFHTKTFVDGHSMFRCILGIFCLNFLIFSNAFKMYFHNRSICSYEPKHHVRQYPLSSRY
jgi:hypothetical protein